MPILVTILVLAVAVPFFGRPPAAPSLDQIASDYVAAFNAKDPARVASFYTEDGEMMAPGSSTFKGREAIAFALESTFRTTNTLALRSVESQAMGPTGYDAGTFSVTLGEVNDDGKHEIFGGRYLTVFKRVGNEWKMAYHMFYTESSPVSEP